MFSGLSAKERAIEMEEDNRFDQNVEERSMNYFAFTSKVFHWCRFFLIPMALIYGVMMVYASRQGINPVGGILFLICVMIYISYLSKGEKTYRQYAREARAAIEQGSTGPYSPKGLELRNKQQKAGKRTYYLIAGMIIFLGLLCVAGGLVIMMLGGSMVFWGSPIFLLSLPCFLLGAFYIRMGRSVSR